MVTPAGPRGPLRFPVPACQHEQARSQLSAIVQSRGIRVSDVLISPPYASPPRAHSLPFSLPCTVRACECVGAKSAIQLRESVGAGHDRKGSLSAGRPYPISMHRALTHAFCFLSFIVAVTTAGGTHMHATVSPGRLGQQFRAAVCNVGVCTDAFGGRFHASGVVNVVVNVSNLLVLEGMPWQCVHAALQMYTSAPPPVHGFASGWY